MKAVVFHDVGDIRVDDVPEPAIKEPTDAIVRLTASGICGTDLHMVRGSMPGMKAGTVLGHEGVGIIEELGRDVRNFRVGDRVVIPATIACGHCAYCRDGYYAQCDRANPHGRLAGTAFFGGPEQSGPFPGLQAEKARIPFAHVGLVRLPEEVSDGQALLLSDVFPTGYFAAELAHVHPGCTVAVFGCGPIGQLAIASLRQLDVGRVFAVDCHADRLEMAREQGAEVVNFEKEDAVETLRRLTGGIGVDRVVDAVGVDAACPHRGPGAGAARKEHKQHREEVAAVAPRTNPHDGHFSPGDAPSQALTWGVRALAKAGTLAVVGVYPPSDRFFPIGEAMNKNLTLRTGNCDHRKYIPKLLDWVRTGLVDPSRVLTQKRPLAEAVRAYEALDIAQTAWVKVELQPNA